MANKAAIACLAAIVVVAVVATIAAVTTSRGAKEGVPLSTATKLSAFCSSTLYPARCEESLSSMVNSSAEPADVFKAAVQVALDEVAAAFDRSAAGIGKTATDSITQGAVESCKKLLDDATDDLKGIASIKPEEVATKTDDLRVWLSSVMTYIYTCADDFDKPELKEAMDKALQNSTELSSNALAIVTNVAAAVNGADHIFNVSAASSRRLLELQSGVAADEESRRQLLSSDFPEWLSSHDRKLLQAGTAQKPNAVVAQDGSGNFKTITDAVNAIPNSHQGRYIIYVKAGVYNEHVTVPANKPNVFMFGDGPSATRVVGNRSNKAGFATMLSRTFSAEGTGFICKSMGFANTAGPEGGQAVAVHVQADMSVFYNCRFDGYQDTLYVHANRQFFRDCIVSGTVDFIFGNSAAVFQNCQIIARKPMAGQGNMITAQGRTDPNMVTGIVLQSCRIVAEPTLVPVRFSIPTYLGRPWKLYARTVVMESEIGDLVKPEGWMAWDNTGTGLDKLYYAEYANTGPGAGTSRRVKWPGYHVIGKAEATPFTAGPFLRGATFIQSAGVPFQLGLTK